MAITGVSTSLRYFFAGIKAAKVGEGAWDGFFLGVGISPIRSQLSFSTKWAIDPQVLLSGTVAAEVRALWPTLRADLRDHLDSSNKADIDAYMFDASSKIPKRAGYYIGMLIAQRLARQHTFTELCRLQGQQLRSEVARALLDL